MSADHRKPVVAFVVLAFLAAAVVGIQHADARTGQFVASVLGVRVEGALPGLTDSGPDHPDRPAPSHPAFTGLADPGQNVAAPDENDREKTDRQSAPSRRMPTASRVRRAEVGPAAAQQVRRQEPRVRRTTKVGDRARSLADGAVSGVVDRRPGPEGPDGVEGAPGRGDVERALEDAADALDRATGPLGGRR